MRQYLSVTMVWLLCGAAWAGFDESTIIVARGDANDDNAVNVSDVVFLSNYLYNGGAIPPCKNQADVNHDGRIDNSDPVYLLNYLFNGGSAPPSPGPNSTTCTASATPTISCLSGC